MPRGGRGVRLQDMRAGIGRVALRRDAHLRRRALDPREEARVAGRAEAIAEDERACGPTVGIEWMSTSTRRRSGRVPRPGGGERRVIGAMILRDAARDVGAGKPPAPQVARTARTTRHQAQAAADLHRLAGLRLRADAVVDARVALIFAAVEVDPGAGAALHSIVSFVCAARGDGIDVAILQHHQRRFGQAQRGA